MSELKVLSAYEQKEIATFPLVDKKEALQILEKSHGLFKNRKSWLPLSERLEILEKAQNLVRERREQLAMDAATEGGKPLVDSLVEVDRACDGIGVAIKEIVKLSGKEIPMNLNAASKGRMAYTRHDPRGVVVAVSAFNHPFNLIIHQVVPAVAAGCPVIIKPAPTTPISCKNIVEILYEAGLPKDWCRLVNCENDVAEILVTDERNSFLTFIGSAKVGWYLRSKLPPGASCTLEHGGCAPVIVDESADLDKAIPLLVRGGFYHAGQVCVSVQRIFVHSSVAKELTDKFVAAVKKLKVGDPTKIETEVGPLILPKEVDRVHSWVSSAVEEGAELLCGGKKVSDTCYEPTVLFKPSKKSTVSQKEIFGPVVCIYPYDSFDEAIKEANDVDFAFQAAIFSNNLDNTLSAVEQLEGLAIMVNDHTAFRVDWMPFGGYKQSGLGVGGIGYTLHDVTIEKMFVFNR